MSVAAQQRAFGVPPKRWNVHGRPGDLMEGESARGAKLSQEKAAQRV